MNPFRIDAEYPPFVRDYKAAVKKFPSLNRDIKSTFEVLETNSRAGDAIPGYKEAVWKIRIGVKGQMGKSSGYRLIYHVDWSRQVITPLALYFKPETPQLSDAEIAARFERLARYFQSPPE